MRIPLATTTTMLLTAALLLPVAAHAGHREAATDQEPEEICEALPDDVPIEQTMLGRTLVSASSRTAQLWTWDAGRAAAAPPDRARR